MVSIIYVFSAGAPWMPGTSPVGDHGPLVGSLVGSRARKSRTRRTASCCLRRGHRPGRVWRRNVTDPRCPGRPARAGAPTAAAHPGEHRLPGLRRPDLYERRDDRRGRGQRRRRAVGPSRRTDRRGEPSGRSDGGRGCGNDDPRRRGGRDHRPQPLGARDRGGRRRAGSRRADDHDGSHEPASDGGGRPGVHGRVHRPVPGARHGRFRLRDTRSDDRRRPHPARRGVQRGDRGVLRQPFPPVGWNRRRRSVLRGRRDGLRRATGGRRGRLPGGGLHAGSGDRNCAPDLAGTRPAAPRRHRGADRVPGGRCVGQRDAPGERAGCRGGQLLQHPLLAGHGGTDVTRLRRGVSSPVRDRPHRRRRRELRRRPVVPAGGGTRGQSRRRRHPARTGGYRAIRRSNAHFTLRRESPSDQERGRHDHRNGAKKFYQQVDP